MNKIIDYILFGLILFFIFSIVVFAKDVYYDFSSNIYFENTKPQYLRSGRIKRYTKYGTNQSLFSLDPFSTQGDVSYSITEDFQVDDYVKQIAYVSDYLYFKYNDREYFAVGQKMIWDYVKTQGSVIFLGSDDSLNKYKKIENEITNEISDMFNYKLFDCIGLGENIYLDANKYEIVDSYNDNITYSYIDNKIVFTGNRVGSTIFTIKRKNNIKDYDMQYFSNQTLTDYISAGNFNDFFDLEVTCIGGRLDLGIHYIDVLNNDNPVVRYGIYDSNDLLVFEYDINKDGIYSSKDLNIGKYYIKEIDNAESKVYGFNIDNGNNIVNLELNIVSNVKDQIIEEEYIDDNVININSIDNLDIIDESLEIVEIEVPDTASNRNYNYYLIGMIYCVKKIIDCIIFS